MVMPDGRGGGGDPIEMSHEAPVAEITGTHHNGTALYNSQKHPTERMKRVFSTLTI